MVQLQKLEEKLELRCCPTKLFGMLMKKQPNFTDICSTKVTGVQVLQDDGCIRVGGSRKWNCIIDGKSQEISERIEEVDEENKMVHRKIIGGEILKDYNSLENKIQVIPKEDDDESCILIFTVEYEKINEASPEPQKMMDFAVTIFKEVACHFTK